LGARRSFLTILNLLGKLLPINARDGWKAIFSLLPKLPIVAHLVLIHESRFGYSHPFFEGYGNARRG
jgi:hypothetical protein